MNHYFTFRLFRAGRIVRVGKGTIVKRGAAKVRAYLKKRYPRTRWSHFRLSWHGTESAAFKAAARLTDGYRRLMGKLPPRNARRGGSGGRATKRCRGRQAGKPCPNAAIVGNYGFCHAHR
ncbi:MAG: hypothetical protein H0V44_11380 [Planctomycetes bacterium]|nr:hypothetical protein [Planctomycetota bacterium]